MITIGMDYQILPNKEEIFIEKFKGVIELLEKTDSHQTTRLFKDALSSQSSFLVISEWESRDAFFDFIKSDIFRETTDWGKDGILADRPRHIVYKSEKLERPE